MKKVLTILVAVLLSPQVLLQNAGSYAADDAQEFQLPAKKTFRDIYNKSNDIQTDKTNGVTGQHLKITVTPADLPYPLLKYRFNTYVTEMKSGNAAPLYLEAAAKLENIRNMTLKDKVYNSPDYAKAKFPELFNIPKEEKSEYNAIDKLLFKAFPIKRASKVLDEITAEQEETLFHNLQSVYDLIERASKKRECDWSYLIRHEGLMTLLPHIDSASTLRDYLDYKAKWEIRNGKYGDAVKTIRLGIRFAEHIENSDFLCLVTLLYANAIKTRMLENIMLLSAQPHAPNLYPALTQINKNKNTYKKGLQMEQYAMLITANMQKCQDLIERADEISKEDCKMLLETIATTLMVGMNSYNSGKDVRDRRDTTLTFVCSLCYPHGKARLLKRGLTEAEIDKLSVYQIVTPFIAEEIKAAYDKAIVLSVLPVDSKHTAIEIDTDNIHTGSPVDIYLGLLMPAITMANNAFLRTEQLIDLLQITEAIRYYAAVNNGNLPESLDQIEQLHVNKIGVVNNKPFAYRVEGNKVIIDFQYLLRSESRLEITLDKK
ncbi:MAG: hypothetical protein LBJ00_04545 [Planctomycetaceae bacterium]|jgi:hypothetical protein|nr:hypothetical protein [Planctomycetaceae bacterium]